MKRSEDIHQTFYLLVTDFITLDLTSLQGSIQAETRIEIDGIIGVDGIKQLGMIIDLSRGLVTIKSDIVK